MKICNYNNCRTELPDTQFSVCEVCRALILRNATVFLFDPLAAVSERSDAIADRMRENMTAAEILNFEQKMEDVYLNFKKYSKLHGLQATPNRVKLTSAEFVQTERDKENNRPDSKRVKILRKAQDKLADRTAKQAALLGVSKQDAIKFFNEVDSDF